MEKIICVCVCVCVNSTFGRCCHCPCEKDNNHGGGVDQSSESGDKEYEDDDTEDEESEIGDGDNSGSGGKKGSEGGEEVLYYKLGEKDESQMSVCFNEEWYNEKKDTVLLLEEAKEGDTGAFKVSGAGNKWKIEDCNGILSGGGFDSSQNTWIIVKIADHGTYKVFLCYDLSPITYWLGNMEIVSGVFGGVKCGYFTIMAANTQAVKDMRYLFSGLVASAEKDPNFKTNKGLIGLEKLNMESVEKAVGMLSEAIYKQVTLSSVAGWRFKANVVDISTLFFSRNNALNFKVLDKWRSDDTSATTRFVVQGSYLKGVFFWGRTGFDSNNLPSWINDVDSEDDGVVS